MRNRLEKMLRAANPGLVLDEAEQYFALPAPDPADAVWAAVKAAEAAGHLRAWGKAVAWSDRGLAMEPADPEAEGWLRFYAGSALIYIGDLYRAEQELNRFAEQAQTTARLERFRGDVLFNLAYLKRALAQTREEIDLFGRAREAFEAAQRPWEVPSCHYEIGWTYLLNGDPDRARPCLQAAADGLVNANDPALETDLQIAWALYHSLCGDHGESGAICARLLAGAELLPEQSADVKWILGCNALKAGRTEEAQRCAEEAFEAAVECWWPPQLERISALEARFEAGGRAGR